LAAFVGITVRWWAARDTNSPMIFAAVAAAIVIGWNGWRLLRPAMNELMDRAPGRELEESTRAIAESVAGVEYVEKCFVRKMGHQFYVDMHVEGIHK